MTPFTRDGEVDHTAIRRLGAWLGSFNGVKGLVVLGHAGEGTFLTTDEQTAVIKSFGISVEGKNPIIAGITLEGTKVAALEAKRAKGPERPPASFIRRMAGSASGIRRERRRIAIVRFMRRAACR